MGFLWILWDFDGFDVENFRDPLRFFGIPWNFDEVLGFLLIFLEILRDFCGILCNCDGFFGILWDFDGFFEIFLVSFGIFRDFFRVPRGFLR